MLVSKIISGGQTGADRGGLDAAASLGIDHGGFCPKGRKSEDGAIPGVYKLVETSSSDYRVRTRMNVENSDATIVFATGSPGRGSRLTIKLAQNASKPFLFIDLAKRRESDIPLDISTWLSGLKKGEPGVLNVAGSRESGDPGIQLNVRNILSAALRHTNKIP